MSFRMQRLLIYAWQYLPILIDKVEKICEENGLRNDSIVMRMTGCPNGCARPYVAGTPVPENMFACSNSFIDQRWHLWANHPGFT